MKLESLSGSDYVYILPYTKILEVNLFAFACRLFRRDFSPLDGTYCNMQANATNKLTSRIFVYKSSPLSTLPLVIPEYI